MSRPYDWAPLAEVDPLPGDPEGIRRHGENLRSAAKDMQDQVAALRRMVDMHRCVGGYTTGLQIKAEEVAKKLEPVVTRYSTVADCLQGWARDLDDFQYRTLQIRQWAQDAADRYRAHNPDAPPLPMPFDFSVLVMRGAGPTAGDDEAIQDLVRARHELDKTLAEAADRDRYWGDKIAVAIDDKLHDGFWDHVHSFVEHHAKAIEDFTTMAGYLTSALAIVAIAVPGLNVVVLSATVGIAVIHAGMAAEGEGSWREVGMDALALASFAGGKALSKGLEHIAERTSGAAAKAAGEEAAERFTRTAEEAAAKAAQGSSGALKEGQATRLSEFKITKGAEAARANAARAVLDRPEEAATVGQAYAAGARDDARLANTINRLTAEHPGDKAVQYAARNLHKVQWAGRANVATATTIDFADKTAHWSETYRGFKDRFKMAEGALR